MKSLDRSGHALLHVLIVAVIVLVCAASLVQMVFERQAATARTTDSTLNRATDMGGWASVEAAWAQSGIVCSNVPNYACAPISGAAPGSCTCTCTPVIAGQPYVRAHACGASPAQGWCKIDVSNTNAFPAATCP